MSIRLISAIFGVLALLSQPAQAGAWRLVWSDEFSYEGLPDPARWDYEEGFVRNREMQYYTRDRLENARVEDGVLIIEGQKKRFRNPKYRAGSGRWQEQREFASYTAASLVSRGKASWTYGRVEVRARLPQGKGVWPAIWTLGDNHTDIGWPRCGEIDIMEFVGKAPHLVHANVHFAVEGEHRSESGKLDTSEPYADFHVYAMEWFEDRIDFFFDNNRFHSVALDQAGEGAENPFRKPHYLLINLALGGSWGGPIDDTVLPQQYLVDYVRVFQLDVKEDPAYLKSGGR